MKGRSFLERAIYYAILGCLLLSPSGRAFSEERQGRLQVKRQIEESAKLLALLRNRQIQISGSREDVLTMTLCVDSSCSEEYRDQAKIVSSDKALAVAFLIAYRSGSFDLNRAGRGLVDVSFREIFEGSGLFEDYGSQRVNRIEINGHADLEESIAGTLYDRLGGSCSSQGLASDGNRCLGYLRALSVGRILQSTLVSIYGEKDYRLDSLSISWHESPFLEAEEAEFPGFLSKIGAYADKKSLANLLNLPIDWDQAVDVRQAYSKRVSGSDLYRARGLMQKFRSVIVVIHFE